MMIGCISRRHLAAVFACALSFSAADLLAEAPKVLLLGDAGSEAQVQSALRSAGHEVVYGGLYYEWDGVDPDVNDFDVVVYLDGIDYGYGLLPTADAAVSAFVAAGGGLVITEWSTYDGYYDDLSPGISALMPVVSPDGDYDYGATWQVLDPTHQLAAWLPAQWTDGAGYGIVAPHANATVAMEGVDGNPMLTYRTDVGGRVVHVNHDLTYTTERIGRYALQVMVNAVEFASSLPPADCNSNGVLDFLDFANGDGTDVNRNRVLDECDPDCNDNGIPDDLDVVPGSGFTMVPFEFDVTTPADWDYVASCDDCDTGEIPLPFSVALGNETLVQFVQNSNGYVELLRTGESAYDYGYGSVRDLIESGSPRHTFLMAAYDDLSSSSVGGYGYKTEPGRVTFYWETPTYQDNDGTYDWMNVFQIVLHADGTVQWNFGSAGVASYDYDLFSGLYLGYDTDELYRLESEFIPTVESWIFTGPTPAYSADVNFNMIPDECEPDCNGNGLPDDLDVAPPIGTGLTQVPFGFVAVRSLQWSDACDTCNSGPVALPFPATLGTETYVAFQQTSDGYVELLRAGETPYGFYYGYVDSLIAYTGGNPADPRHTFLLAAFDDLDSEYLGRFGYILEDTRVVFYWYTETYEDDDDGLHNEFEIILSDDSSVRWNFASALFSGYGYDLFTGLYLGHGDQTLYEITSGNIPERESWIFTETGLPGGGSEDANSNGIPDECEGQGDMNDDGVVDLADLPGFLACLQGPDVFVGAECQRADFDRDSDVDLKDVAAFSNVFQGD